MIRSAGAPVICETPDPAAAWLGIRWLSHLSCSCSHCRPGIHLEPQHDPVRRTSQHATSRVIIPVHPDHVPGRVQDVPDDQAH